MRVRLALIAPLVLMCAVALCQPPAEQMGAQNGLGGPGVPGDPEGQSTTGSATAQPDGRVIFTYPAPDAKSVRLPSTATLASTRTAP